MQSTLAEDYLEREKSEIVLLDMYNNQVWVSFRDRFNFESFSRQTHRTQHVLKHETEVPQ